MKVKLSKQSEKFMLKIEEKLYTAIFEILRFLEANPIPYKEYDLIKIKGTKNGYRIRKGKIRILYSIEKELDLIFIEKIDWRDETTYK